MNKLNLNPLSDRIVVRRVESPTQTKGGLFLPEASVDKASSEASEGAFGEFFEYSGLCDKGEAREVWEASQNSFKQRVIELLEEHWGKSIDRINFLHEIENL